MDTDRHRKTVLVRDIMTSCPTALAPHESLADAARRFTEDGISGAPVVDRGLVVGVLSKSDLVERSPFIPHSPRARVGDAMTRRVHTVSLQDPAMSAVRRMVEAHVHRMIVVDPLGKPVGVLTTTDILKALIRGEPLQLGEAEFLAREERHAAPAQAVPPTDPTPAARVLREDA
jgi:CBS domain-containing protein